MYNEAASEPKILESIFFPFHKWKSTTFLSVLLSLSSTVEPMSSVW